MENSLAFLLIYRQVKSISDTESLLVLVLAKFGFGQLNLDLNQTLGSLTYYLDMLKSSKNLNKVLVGLQRVLGGIFKSIICYQNILLR